MAPANLVFSQQPVDTTAGTANPGASAGGIVVNVTDGLGAPVAGDSITLVVQSGPGTMTVTSPQLTDASGNATFADAVITTAGAYTLSAGDGVLSAVSNSFNINPAAAGLVFTTQPTDVVQGSVLNSIAVTKEDTYGNIYADSDQVDFSVASCGGFTIGSVAMVSGVATLPAVQRFYTVAASLQVTANDTTAVLSNPSQAFAVTANPDFVFSDGYEVCRP